MIFQNTMDHFLPNLSEMGAAIKAPIRVPIESFKKGQRMTWER
jgi:hypothetical protein